jgi:hypothetical protein
MSGLANNFDPELLQARWVLGGIEPEQFVAIAVSALEQGFDGTTLQQIAGLSRPTLGDLGTLPVRLFADMGLAPINQNEAVDRLLARGEPATSPVISVLRKAFPDFGQRWKKHVISCGGNPAGSYIDMVEFVLFVHFVIEDLHEKGKLEVTHRAFRLLEKLLVEADQETRDLIGLGFFEALQNVASHRPHGNKVYEQYFGPMSKKVWCELQTKWAGKSSLMDVIRAEQKKK